MAAPLCTGLRPKFVLFGDSLTERSFALGGWGARLADHYSRKVDVVNRGFSGYNTRWALKLLPKLFSKADVPELVTVFFGANDAALSDGPDSRQHVPLEEYSTNLERIVDYVKGIGCEHILLITPPPLDEIAWNRFQGSKEFDRKSDVTETYIQACIGVAKKKECPIVDIYSSFLSQKWETDLSDGLHFNSDGQECVFKWVTAEIEKNFDHLRVDNLPMDFPSHQEVDHLNPEASFQSKQEIIAASK